eukprot:COSAG05_NODE_15851_length_359_cov_0.992308_1_plen_76_part_10
MHLIASRPSLLTTNCCRNFTVAGSSASKVSGTSRAVSIAPVAAGCKSRRELGGETASAGVGYGRRSLGWRKFDLLL